jgi:hypothetical protein
VPVSSARPFPDSLEESMINVVKDLFAELLWRKVVKDTDWL